MLADAIRAVAIAWILGMAILVFSGLLSGRIPARGLLSRKLGPNPSDLSPERVQLLIATIATSGMYVSRVVMAADHTTLPEVDTAWLVAAGGSNGIYMLGKLIAFIRVQASKPSQQPSR